MKTQPLISVCLPNLNTRPYLEERVETIFAQTYPNWEMIISDNYSEDGAWEYFQGVAARDERVKIEQAPKKGLYANWNNCIERAQGEYVYIATSDDTMAEDCLEKLAAALEENRDCDLAHCPLVMIDPAGQRLDFPTWPGVASFAQDMPELAYTSHVRRAPYDGLLHLTGNMVYLSITQLLIRRSLFSRIGGFEPRWGSIGDINWEMKAGLASNTVHVADTWGSFRVHPAQATASVKFHSPEHEDKVQEMILDAVDRCAPYLAPPVLAGLRDRWIAESRVMRKYYQELGARPGTASRRMFQAAEALTGDALIRQELLQVQRGGAKWPDRTPGELRKWLESLGMESICLPLAAGRRE